jgi:ABC-type lipopolysaccharide export system ATPase subunit
MARISTRQASEKIRNLEAFTTNGSLRGDWQGGAYVVTSYSTAIAYIDPTEGVALLNGEKYSVTTSKHQTQARLGVHYLAQTMALYEEELENELAFIQRTFRA